MTGIGKTARTQPRPGVASLGLHLTYAVACAGVCLYLYFRVDIGIPTVVMVVLLLALWFGATIAPASLAPLALLMLAVLVRLFTISESGQGVWDVDVLLLAALLPITHQLAAVVAGMPARGRFEWLAIRPTVVRCVTAVAAIEVLLLAIILAS